MTDRISGYIVTLKDDIRDDDAEQITNAIKMVKNVLTVEPIVSDIQTHIAYQRVKHEMVKKLYDVFK